MNKFFNSLLLFLVTGIFLYAGVSKFLAPRAFLLDIEGYRLPLGALAEIAAYYLPALEIVAAIALLWRKTRSASLLICGFLFVIFIFGLLQAVARGFVVSCGCYGESTSPPSTQKMALGILSDIGLLGAVCWLYKKGKAKPFKTPCRQTDPRCPLLTKPDVRKK